MISGILAIVLWGLNFLVFDSIESEPFTLMDTSEPLTIEFPFINQGANSLEITSVTTSCGCLAASWPKGLLASGERGVITLVFDPRNQSGEIFREAFVYTSDSSEIPVAELHVRGTIVDSPYRGYPVKMGELRLKTRDVRFGKVVPGTKAVERIECINTGSQPLSISLLPGFAPSWISLRVDLHDTARHSNAVGEESRAPVGIIPPGATADLVITVEAPYAAPDPSGFATQDDGGHVSQNAIRHSEGSVATEESRRTPDSSLRCTSHQNDTTGVPRHASSCASVDISHHAEGVESVDVPRHSEAVGVLRHSEGSVATEESRRTLDSSLRCTSHQNDVLGTPLKIILEGPACAPSARTLNVIIL